MSLADRLDGLEQLAENANKLSDGRPWSTLATPSGGEWVDGYVVMLGVNEWFEPSHDLPHFKDYAAFIAAADPQVVAALVNVAKAAADVQSWLENRPFWEEGDPEFRGTVGALHAAFARLAAVLKEGDGD